MAISDVGQEESFYAEIDKKTGFSTEILLATPLYFDGETIGVLEFINRGGEPPYKPFTAEEMDQVAIYAEAIAALVNASLTSHLSTALAERICEGPEEASASEIREWIQGLRGKREHKEVLELATLVKEVSDRGLKHRKLCRELLESIAEFTGDSGGLDYSDV